MFFTCDCCNLVHHLDKYERWLGYKAQDLCINCSEYISDKRDALMMIDELNRLHDLVGSDNIPDIPVKPPDKETD